MSTTDGYYRHQMIQWTARLNELRRMKEHIEDRMKSAENILATLRKNRLEVFE